MELIDLIDELKKDNNKDKFNEIVNKILLLIFDEIGDYSLPYTYIFDLDENIEYKDKELESFINSETEFKDIIKGNITDLQSFSKVVSLVSALGEMQIRKQNYRLFYSNIVKAFEDELFESLKSGLETSDEFFKIYSQLIPYINLDNYIILYDWENSLNIIKNNFEYYENEYWGVDYCTSANEIIINSLYTVKSEFLIDIVLKKNKSKQYGELILKIRESAIKEIETIKIELEKKDCDIEMILKKIEQLSNPILLGEVLCDSFILDDINDIFLKLKEKRIRYL